MTQDSTRNTTGVHYAPFAGERRKFFLPVLGELRLLQEKLDLGPALIEQAFRKGFWKAEYISDTIKYALIGGGMLEAEADNLVNTTITSGKLLRHLPLAHDIIIETLGPIDGEDAPGNLPSPLENPEAVPSE